MQINILLYSTFDHFSSNIHINCCKFAEEQKPATKTRQYLFTAAIKHLKKFMQERELQLHR